MRLFRGRHWITGIGAKVFANSFLSVLMVLSVVGILVYNNIYVKLKDNQQELLRTSVTQSEEYLKQYMRNIQTQLLFLANETIFRSLRDDDYVAFLDIMKTLYSEDINCFYLIRNNERIVSVPYGYGYYHPKEWIIEVSEQAKSKGLWWSEPRDLGWGKAVTVAKSFVDPVDGSNYVVGLEINPAKLSLSLAEFGKGANLFLFTRSGEFISTNAKAVTWDEQEQIKELADSLQGKVDQVESDLGTMDSSVGKWNVFMSANNRWDWVVFAVVKQSEAFPLLLGFRNQVIIILSVWLILSVLMSYLLAVYIRKPIIQIARLMRKGSEGDWSARVNMTRQDEFEIIGNSFNTMMRNIKMMFDNLKLAEERKRYQELKVLQSQIRPHFLYNTLNAFYIFCEMNGAKPIGKLIRSLLGLLKYSIDKVADLVSVEEEIVQAYNYVELIKLRYGDTFDLEIDIPDTIRDIQLPKLTFITLLENSIFYGMQKTSSRNSIRIYHLEDSDPDKIIMAISDTGPGIDPSKMDKLFSKEERDQYSGGLNNLGIRNVHERIQLYCGENYGLKIDSTLGEGVTVYISVLRRIAIAEQPVEGETRDGFDQSING
ncbi:MAG: sensor histidine kinase [Paenibacillus sp.]|jgi:sensor histidine kinase YesM|nr:sensor histidine kinase [Paenibacillus sp.]